MPGAVALLIGGVGVALLYAALTGQSFIAEVKAAASGGPNPGRSDTALRAVSTTAPDAMVRLGQTVGAPGTTGLVEPFRSRVSALLYEAGGRVTIVSGRRSYQEQARLYAKYQAGTGNLAARPGSSKHEQGLAVDFGGDVALAERLAPKYGLRQTVPGERWHFE